MKTFFIALNAIAILSAIVLPGCGANAPDQASQPKSKPSSVRLAHDMTGIARRAAATAPLPDAIGTQSARREFSVPGLNLVNNPGFETGAAAWLSSDQVIDADEEVASQGAGYGWLGGGDNRGDFLRQDIILPENAEQISLQYDVAVVSDEPSTAPARDTMHVDLVDIATGAVLARLATYTNIDADAFWRESESIDLTRYKGRKVALMFSATTNESNPTSFVVDEVKMLATVSDVVTVAGMRNAFNVQRAEGDRIIITDRRTGLASAYTSLKRLVFSDAVLVFDVSESPAKLYRLYRAAFARIPDVGGLGYWITVSDNHQATLDQIADAFMASDEFKKMYGQPTNAQFVAYLYSNVLARAPDAAGLAFHKRTLDSGALTRSQVLMEFANSPENIDQIRSSIANGFEYIQPPGLTSPATPPQAARTPAVRLAELMNDSFTVPTWENCPAGYEVMKDNSGNPMTHGGGACIKKTGAGGSSGGTPGSGVPPTPGVDIPPGGGGATPGTPVPGASTKCKFMNSAKQCVQAPTNYIVLPADNPDRSSKDDVCRTVQAAGYPVQLATCSYASGGSGYVIVHNIGPKADVCWVVSYNSGRTERLCDLDMPAGKISRSSCYSCGRMNGGARGIELETYRVK